MNDPVTICVTGGVTADLTLKTSQNGKNTKYVQFNLAVTKGYGDNAHPNYYNCVAYGEMAQRMVDAKIKKGSKLQITGDLDLVSFTRKDGTEGMLAKITLYNWNFALTNKPKSDNNGAEDDSEDDYDSMDCGDDGLPFN